MASSTEICNQALILLGQEPIITLDDSTKQSRLCKRLYQPVLEALLRAYPWTFAIKRRILARDLEMPEFGYIYQYTLPSECLRIVSVNIPDDEYVIEKNKILTDHYDVRLRYVGMTDSANDFDAQFVQVLAHRLAKTMCQALTADQDLFVKLSQVESQLIMLAQNTNAIETTPQPVVEGPWIPSRY